jgi:hypothetical protein
MKLLALGTLALCGTLCLYLLSETPSLSPQQQLFLASENEQDIQKAFIEFLARYGRSYASKSEAGTRYQAFKENYEAIQKHDRRSRSGYTLGVN